VAAQGQGLHQTFASLSFSPITIHVLALVPISYNSTDLYVTKLIVSTSSNKEEKREREKSHLSLMQSSSCVGMPKKPQAKLLLD
jgi:hypothetical protein